MIRLVAFDLDGTVLNEDSQASEASLEAIRSLAGRGIVAASISGRNVANSQRPFAAVPELIRDFYFGCYNGSVVLSAETDGRRELLCEERLPGEIFLEAVDYIDRRGLNFIYCSCELDSGHIKEAYIADRDSDAVQALAKLVGRNPAFDKRLISRVRNGDLGPPPKLIVLSGTGRRDEIACELREIFADRAYLSPTGADRVELMHREVDKGAALQAIAEASGVPVEACLSVGDGDNDLPMLRRAGIGVLLGSADEGTRKAAQSFRIHVGPPFSEEGFAKVVQRYALAEKMA